MLEDEEAADDSVVDPRDVFNLLFADDDDERDALLERYAGKGKVENDIVRELSDTRALADVDGFEAAHRRTLHSLEVLNRNGGRPARMPKLALVKPIASALVSLVLGFIIRNYRNSLSRDIRRMYERRFAAAASGTPASLRPRRPRCGAGADARERLRLERDRRCLTHATGCAFAQRARTRLFFALCSRSTSPRCSSSGGTYIAKRPR